MTIKKFLLQLSFIFALIIGIIACEKDLPEPDNINSFEQNFVSDDDDNATHGDWQTLCDSLVDIWGNHLDSLGIDYSTWCDSIDIGWGDWDFDCDSLVAEYADKLEALGIDPATFCDSLDGDWDWGGHGGHDDDDTGHGGWGDWDFDCDSLVAEHGDKLEDWGIDIETFCDSLDGDWDWDDWGDWGGHDDDDSDDDSDDDDDSGHGHDDDSDSDDDSDDDDDNG